MSLTVVKRFLYCCFIGSIFFGCVNDQCNKDVLVNDYPEIKNFLEQQEIESLVFDSCKIVQEYKSVTFHGQTERKNNGHFYNDSCHISQVRIQYLYFTDTSYAHSWNKEFRVYEFGTQEEKEKFGAYKRSIERYLSRNKELNEFFESKDKWFMYYIGFP